MLSWLTRLGIETGGFDQAQLFFRGLSSWPTRVLLILLLLAGTVWAWSSVRELPSRRQRGLLIFLQSLVLLLLALILTQPAIRLAKLARLKERAVVLIDTSASMTLPGEAGAKRSEEASRFLAKHSGFFQKLEEEFLVSYFGFDQERHELGQRPTAELPSLGQGTDLFAALSDLGSQGGGLPLAGVVMISDGADLGKLRATKKEEEIAKLLANFGAPVNTVACGVSAQVKDVAIVDAHHDDYGFVHNPFEVSVKVHVEGELAHELTVIFKQGERVLASKTIPLPPGQKDAEATVSFTPRQVGKFMFSIEVPPVSGEITTLNNIIRFPLRVLRDKVRALYLVGNPSWDERFLRQTLKKNPAMDLVCFYILREHWDNFEAGEDEVSLIPFPTDELFREELDTFDLVIWQNFRGELYMFGAYPTYMQLLNRYIKERGGALLMIGGHRAFLGPAPGTPSAGGNQQYQMDPSLAEILPIIPSPQVPNYAEGDFKMALTPAGRSHPILAVGEPGEDVAGVWSALPPLSGFNRVLQLAPGALALATHPTERGADGNLLPIIAIREVGKGRVMGVMTDYSWVWNLVAVGMGLSNKPYQRFWENAVRWLLQDPEMRLVSLSADRSRVEPGEPVTLTLEVLDETYHPADQAEAKLEIIEQPTGSNLQPPPLEKIAAGKYRAVLKPEVQGGYVIRGSASQQGRSLGYDDEIIEAAEKSLEYSQIAPRPDLLLAISKATQGQSINVSEDPAAFAFHRHGLSQVIGTRDLDLWDNLPFFLLTFSLMVLTWLLRRKWGLR